MACKLRTESTPVSLRVTKRRSPSASHRDEPCRTPPTCLAAALKLEVSSSGCPKEGAAAGSGAIPGAQAGGGLLGGARLGRRSVSHPGSVGAEGEGNCGEAGDNGRSRAGNTSPAVVYLTLEVWEAEGDGSEIEVRVRE